MLANASIIGEVSYIPAGIPLMPHEAARIHS